jgi:hypothetical protein
MPRAVSRTQRFAALLPVVLSLLLSCGKGDAPVAPSTPVTPSATAVASVGVSPSSASVFVGSSVTLAASVKDGGGVVLTGRTVTWTSSDTTKARVSATGLVTAVAVGSATITATSEGKAGTATVTVAVPAIAVSYIRYQSRLSTGPLPVSGSSAATYKATVDSLISQTPLSAGYCDAEVAAWQSLNNAGACPTGTNSNMIVRVTARVVIQGGSVATWQVRFNTDLGGGGALFVDDSPVFFRAGDISPNETLNASVSLAPGIHDITLRGFEGCCDGAGSLSMSYDGVTWIPLSGATYAQVAQLRLSTSPPLYREETAQLSVVVTDAAGTPLSDVPVSFRASEKKRNSTFDRIDWATVTSDGHVKYNGCQPNVVDASDVTVPCTMTGMYVVATARGKTDSVLVRPNHTNQPTVQYTKFVGSAANGFVTTGYLAEGTNIALVTQHNEYNPATLNKMVQYFDAIWTAHRAAAPRAPSAYRQINGKPTIDGTTYASCGSGCGSLGNNGIEIGWFNLDLIYKGVLNRDRVYHIVAYEFGRSFWFYGSVLGNATPTWNGGFTTFMQTYTMEQAGVKTDAYPENGIPWETFVSCTERLVDVYLADQGATWNNSLNPPFPDGLWNRKLSVPVDCQPTNYWGATELSASVLFKLYRTFGASFVQKMWPALSNRPVATSNTDAVDNWVLAASEAAGRNLAVFFSDTWRWPVSATAKAEAFTRWGAGKTTIP